MKQRFLAFFSIFGVAALAAFALAACGQSGSSSSATSATSAEIPNPIVEYDTLEEALGVLGFEAAAPGAPEGHTQERVSVIDGKVLQIDFAGEGNVLTYRVAQSGSFDGDLSGDYTEYPEAGTLDVDGTVVHTRGADGKVNVATWEKDGLAHSLGANPGGAGMAQADVESMVRSLA